MKGCVMHGTFLPIRSKCSETHATIHEATTCPYFLVWNVLIMCVIQSCHITIVLDKSIIFPHIFSCNDYGLKLHNFTYDCMIYARHIFLSPDLTVVLEYLRK